MAKEKKEHVSGRVSSEAIANVIKVADALKWSFNQTLEQAMIRINASDIINEIKDDIDNQMSKW